MSPKTSATEGTEAATRTEQVLERTSRNRVAALLSIIPGLGHVYKGHYRVGLVLCFLGVPVVLWSTILISLATFGVGLLLPAAYWVMVGLNAYWEPDWREGHHRLVI